MLDYLLGYTMKTEAVFPSEMAVRTYQHYAVSEPRRTQHDPPNDWFLYDQCSWYIVVNAVI